MKQEGEDFLFWYWGLHPFKEVGYFDRDRTKFVSTCAGEDSGHIHFCFVDEVKGDLEVRESDDKFRGFTCRDNHGDLREQGVFRFVETD